MFEVASILSAIEIVSAIRFPIETLLHVVAFLLAIGGGLSAAVIWGDASIGPLDQ